MGVLKQKWECKGILKAQRSPTNRRYYTHEQYLEYQGLTIELAIQPDHVHLFIRSNPYTLPTAMTRLLKGRSAPALREEFPHLIPTCVLRDTSQMREGGHRTEALRIGFQLKRLHKVFLNAACASGLALG